MADSWLHEAVCRQSPELWLTVGFIESVCRQRPTVGFYFVTVLYCKSLYSSEAATLANSGNISGHIL